MTYPKALLALVLTVPVLAGPFRGREAVVAHEWGTFTSVAGEKGGAVQWMPLSGSSDIPCFVARLRPQNLKLMLASVRMETPVLYFYAERATTISVKVQFPNGWITEWYPPSTLVEPDRSTSTGAPVGFSGGRIQWDGLQVLPGEHPALPTTTGGSHYYAARDTDADPIRMGDQYEKLIFYRGAGNIPIPLRPKFNRDGKIEIENTGSESVPLAILFERRGDRLGYRAVHAVKGVIVVEPPELTANLARMQQDMADSLVEFGLFPKEARAMLETWRDSWFDEGMRLFYVVPRSMVDEALPLTIQPEPSNLTRVFVGRIEMLSPWGDRTLRTALAQADVPALMRFGRFLDALAPRVMAGMNTGSLSLDEARVRLWRQSNASACVQ